MADHWETDLQTLLKQTRICFLATQGSHGPETSMAPYAINHGKILLHLSTLARHTGNIAANPVAGIMICTPETAAESPLALPRLSLQGKVTAVPEEEYQAAKQVYLQAIPDAEPLFSFSDFRLFEFKPQHIHWVGGFGKARDIPLAKWESISHIDIS